MRSITNCLVAVLALAGILTAVPSIPTASAQPRPPAQPTPPAQQLNRWSLTIQGAAKLPQDVWVSALGSNTTGWQSGGSICLGLLAQGFEPGDSITILTDVVAAGLFGPDGFPVPTTDANNDPIVYFAPGIELPDRYFTLAEDRSFYVIIDGYVVESTQPEVFPVGVNVPLMFTFEYQEGRAELEMVAWTLDAKGEWFPFLNEGLMMANVRRVR